MAGARGSHPFDPKKIDLTAPKSVVVVPKDSGKDCNRPAMFAVVNSDGSVVASCGVTRVELFEPGLYVITAGEKVTKCAYQVTQGINGVVEGPPFVGIPLYLRPGVEVDTNQIGVVFLEPGFIFSGLIPADFTLTANC